MSGDESRLRQQRAYVWHALEGRTELAVHVWRQFHVLEHAQTLVLPTREHPTVPLPRINTVVTVGIQEVTPIFVRTALTDCAVESIIAHGCVQGGDQHVVLVHILQIYYLEIEHLVAHGLREGRHIIGHPVGYDHVREHVRVRALRLGVHRRGARGLQRPHPRLAVAREDIHGEPHRPHSTVIQHVLEHGVFGIDSPVYRPLRGDGNVSVCR